MRIKHLSTYLFTGTIALFSAFAFADYSGHGKESVSAETIAKFAAPKLNPTMANKLRKMLDVSAPGMGMLSPDKKTLYFSWKVTGTNQIWRIDGPKSFPVQLTSGNDSVALVAVSNDGKFLLLSKDINGEENPGIYKLDLASGQIEELIRKPKVQAGFSFLTDDSKEMFFTANDKAADSYSIYRMTLADKKIESIYDGKGAWGIADQKNNGELLLLSYNRGGKISEYFTYVPKTKELKAVIGQNEDEDYDVSLAKKDGQFLVLSNKTTDLKKLYLLENGNLKLLTADVKYEISGFSQDHKRTRVIYSIDREGYSDFGVLDGTTYKPVPHPVIPLKEGKPDHVFVGTTTKDGEVSMLGIVTSKSPRVSYSYNWKTKKIQQWVLPSAPEVNLANFAEPVLLNYEAKDKTKIPMFARFPKGCEPENKSRKACPVVVHFHGGPEGQSVPGFSPIAQAFVDEGFVFAEPNVRGSDGYGKAWINMDNGPKRENVIADIEDASIWIKQNWKGSDGATPKIGVMGWSYGGYSTLMAMTRFAGSYDAGVALVGMSNLVSFLNNTAPYRRALRVSEYGDPEKDKEALLKLSPSTYVDKVKAPLMIIQGANDPRVPVGEALQIHETLTKKKIPSELIVFADEGHGSSKKENQILEIGNTIEFMKKHLMTAGR